VELHKLLVAAGVPVLVDPAPGAPPGRYAGAEALLPNRAEAEALLGRRVATPEEGAAAAKELVQRCGVRAVLLKMDRDGMVLARRGAATTHLRPHANHVRGVAGAGDMVLAVAGACRGAWFLWPDAVLLANVAAGLLVQRGPEVPVTSDDLSPFHAGHAAPEKIVGPEALEAIAEGHRRAGRTVVLTNGCFDLLHAGHLFCLERAALLGDVLVVAVNSDASVRRLKGMTRPVVPEAERAALVAGLGCVAHVLLYDEDTPHEVIRRVRPDVLVKGGGYTPEQVVGRELVEAYGGRVCVTGLRQGCSTTQLVERAARRCLLAEDEAA
jgi:D-beta-D-heptose 7-phosphate kinase/D-beta-D-heptose 1-phosphate adenosyltransferase